MVDENPLNASTKNQEWPSIKDLVEKVTIDTLSLFSGLNLHFVEEVNRHLDIPEIRNLVLAASFWLVTTDYLHKIYKEKKDYYLNIKYCHLKLPIALAIPWTILSIITFIYGLDASQKLDSLDMNTLRFFKSFIAFIVSSWVISIVLNYFIKYIKDNYLGGVIIREKN